MGGAISGFVSDRVDHILDDNEDFQAVVLIAFDGALDADSAQRIKYEALLPALVRMYEKLGNSLPRPSRRLVLRRPTEADIAAVLGESRPDRIDFDTFENIARSVFRRVAVDCSKRLFVSIVGGTAAVAVLKQTLRRAPLVGPIFSVLVDPLVPALCVSGPAVGIAAAAHWDHLPRLENRGRQRGAAAAAAEGADGAGGEAAVAGAEAGPSTPKTPAAAVAQGRGAGEAGPSGLLAVAGTSSSSGDLYGWGAQQQQQQQGQQRRSSLSAGMMKGSGSAGSLSGAGGRGAAPGLIGPIGGATPAHMMPFR